MSVSQDSFLDVTHCVSESNSEEKFENFSRTLLEKNFCTLLVTILKSFVLENALECRTMDLDVLAMSQGSVEERRLARLYCDLNAQSVKKSLETLRRFKSELSKFARTKIGSFRKELFPLLMLEEEPYSRRAFQEALKKLEPHYRERKILEFRRSILMEKLNVKMEKFLAISEATFHKNILENMRVLFNEKTSEIGALQCKLELLTFQQNSKESANKKSQENKENSAPASQQFSEADYIALVIENKELEEECAKLEAQEKILQTLDQRKLQLFYELLREYESYQMLLSNKSIGNISIVPPAEDYHGSLGSPGIAASTPINPRFSLSSRSSTDNSGISFSFDDTHEFGNQLRSLDLSVALSSSGSPTRCEE